jgi:hypothetical protein
MHEVFSESSTEYSVGDLPILLTSGGQEFEWVVSNPDLAVELGYKRVCKGDEFVQPNVSEHLLLVGRTAEQCVVEVTDVSGEQCPFGSEMQRILRTREAILPWYHITVVLRKDIRKRTARAMLPSQVQ